MPADETSYVELERSGGQVPTYRPKQRVAVDALSAPERQKLDDLVHRAAAVVAAASKKPVADGFTYRLSVQMAGQPLQSWSFSDQDGHPAAYDELASWVRAKGQ